MKFSIVIPLFNGAKFIKATLDTVIAQTYKDYEVILVNDESPDNVGAIAKEYIALHPEVRFVYIEQKNRGLGGARNTAIRNASGDVIAILDQDDVWYPNKLERVVHIYTEHPDVDIVCHSQNIRKYGKIIGIFRPGRCKKDIFRELLFSKNMLSTSAVTFKLKVIADIGDFSEDRINFHFVEDYDLWIRMAAKGYSFYFTNEILGEYNRHGDNFSAQLETMSRSEWNVLRKHFKNLEHKTSWDSYLMQRRMALSNIRLARACLTNRSWLDTLKYLVKAFCRDPFFISYYLQKWWDGAAAVLLKGGSI